MGTPRGYERHVTDTTLVFTGGRTYAESPGAGVAPGFVLAVGLGATVAGLYSPSQ
jgi:hypothetical protein